jgi:hypothetical protein
MRKRQKHMRRSYTDQQGSKQMIFILPATGKVILFLANGF